MTTPSLSPRGEATPSALQRVLEDYEGYADTTAARAELSALLAEAQAARERAEEAMRDRCLRIAEQEKALAAAAGFVPWSREEGYHAAAERIEQRIRALAAKEPAR